MQKLEQISKGYTLIEVLIASAIFLVFLSAIFTLYVQAIRSYRFGQARIELIQNSRVCIDTISRELKKASFIIYPDEKTLFEEGSSEIIYDSMTSREIEDETFSSTSIFGFRYNQEEKTAEWLMYHPDFDRDNPTENEIIWSKVIGREIESLNFSLKYKDNPQLVTIKLRSARQDENTVSLLTRVFIRY